MTSPMAQIIRLGTVGGYAAMLSGELLEVGGRVHWWSAEQLRADAAQRGITLSPYVIDTTPPAFSVTGRQAAARAA